MKLLHGFLFPRNGWYFSMTNITTQRLALGVLMALVLAFGVLSTADALELRRSSGDLETVAVGGEFDIRFSVRDFDRDTDGESIGIEFPADVTLKQVGRHEVDIDGGSGNRHTMTEDGEDEADLGSSVTLDFIANEAGEVDITITPSSGEPITFTIFIVQDDTTTFSDVDEVSFANRQSLVSTRPDNEVGISFTVVEDDGTTEVEDVAVTLTVSGSGRLFVRRGNRETRATSRLETSSAAADTADGGIFLDVNRGTSRVTVEVAGADPASTIFIFGVPTITLINDDQRGEASEAR